MATLMTPRSDCAGASSMFGSFAMMNRKPDRSMFWSRRHIGRLAPLFVGAGLPVEVIPHVDSDALLLDLVFALGQLIHQLLQADLLVLVDELLHHGFLLHRQGTLPLPILSVELAVLVSRHIHDV